MIIKDLNVNFVSEELHLKSDKQSPIYKVMILYWCQYTIHIINVLSYHYVNFIMKTIITKYRMERLMCFQKMKSNEIQNCEKKIQNDKKPIVFFKKPVGFSEI